MAGRDYVMNQQRLVDNHEFLIKLALFTDSQLGFRNLDGVYIQSRAVLSRATPYALYSLLYFSVLFIKGFPPAQDTLGPLT